MAYPSTLDNLRTSMATSELLADNHVQDHKNIANSVNALEAKVGITGSAVTTSVDYKLSGVTGTDKAVSKTGTETLTNKTLTAPKIGTISNTGTLTLPTSTDTLVGRATTDTLTNKTISTGSKLDANADGNFTYNSIFRQAVINGNFDVWQRNTSFTDASRTYTADRWYAIRYTNTTGISVSRQDGTGVSGSQYCARIQRANGNASTSTIDISQMVESVSTIPFRGKKVTVSFWARKGANYTATADVLTARLLSGTGTDENIATGYTGQATVGTTSATLTTSWQKFSFTTTNVLASNVAEMCVYFEYVPVGTASTNDYYEIAQVQLNAGDIALPFSPKSFDEELRSCQRYYEKSYDYSVVPGTAGTEGGHRIGGLTASSGQKLITTKYITRKRAVPTIAIYDSTGNAGKVTTYDIAGSPTANVTPTGVDYAKSETCFETYIDSSTVCGLFLQWTASAEL